MIDRNAIAAARVAAQAVEAEARALADQLIAAKADRRRLRRDLVLLPERLAGHQQTLVAAQARLTSAQQAHDAAASHLADAQAQAASAEDQASSLDDQLTSTQELLAELMSEGGPGGRPPAAKVAHSRLTCAIRRS